MGYAGKCRCGKATDHISGQCNHCRTAKCAAELCQKLVEKSVTKKYCTPCGRRLNKRTRTED